MRHVLNTNLKLWHIVVSGVLIALLAGGTIALGAGGSVFFPAGSVRLASAYSDSTISITGSNNPPVRVLRTTFSVPAGKTANLQATFSTTLLHETGQYAYCFGEFTLDSAPPDSGFQPGNYQLLGGETAQQPNALTVSMTGYRKTVGPGSHAVNVYVNSAYAGCTLMERALNVIVNIH